ncbi:MAG: hypothetical protein R3C14_49855 [Caldilineaceae bacterium]
MTQIILSFLPPLVALIGACIVLALGWRTPLWTVSVALPLYGVLYLIVLAFTPNRWLRAKATAPATITQAQPTTAVVLGFGYERVGDAVRPGVSNQFLIDWVVAHYPQIHTFYVQEGTLAAFSPDLRRRKAVHRIHAHDPTIYIDTFDATFCAIQKLEEAMIESVLLVAHDLQLQRAAWDFTRIRRHRGTRCVLLIPALPPTPWSACSVHLQTRYAPLYKVGELLYLRPRDLLHPMPADCKRPI